MKRYTIYRNVNGKVRACVWRTDNPFRVGDDEIVAELDAENHRAAIRRYCNSQRARAWEPLDAERIE